ncbi:MAG TPA: hypothetical protein VFN91_07805 [Myxococcaceae bacterium]|nr:hypothetical protein [Myxococcaceae bacterium]
MANALAEVRAAGIREKFIEAGLRSGRLGPYSAPYSREDDGGLIVYLSHERAYVRLHAPTIDGERAQVVAVGLSDFGRRQVWVVRVSLSWDATRVNWRPYDPTRDVAAELWNVVETAALGTGWVLPGADGPERSAHAIGG